MDDDFDEFGNFVGQEYSDSGESQDGWEDVEVVENDHDEQLISEPLVKRRQGGEVSAVDPPVDWSFQFGLKSVPALNRFACILGLTNHGKSSLFQWLMPGPIAPEPRGITMQSNYRSKLLPTAQGKTINMNLSDTPGHEDFILERMNSERATDGHILVVDCVEGTKASLSISPKPHIIALTKFDRLFFELKLPPKEAFERLNHLITEELDTSWDAVVFVSSKFQFSFTMRTINDLYRRHLGANMGTNISDFVLAPIFKLFSYGLLGKSCSPQLESMGILLSPEEWELDFDERITLIMALYFEAPQQALIDAIYENIPLPRNEQAAYYSVGSLWFGRNGSKPIDIPNLTLSSAGLVSEESVPPHSWFYTASKSLEVQFSEPDLEKFKLVTVAVEPIKPSLENIELLETNLRRLSLRFPGISVSSSETGEFVINCTGELYLDTVLNKIEGVSYRVSQPLAILIETVGSETQYTFPTKSPDLSIALTVVAEPLDGNRESGDDLDLWTESHHCAIYGPSALNPEIVDGIVEGIESVLESGPLIESPVRYVRFNVTTVDADTSFQLVSTARRAAYSALMLASPRLLEPQMLASVTGKLAAGKAVYSEVAKRFGTVVTDTPIFGTNLYVTEAEIPLMDSFAVALDILCQLDERSDATVRQQFNKWIEVTGDPLDAEAVTRRKHVAEPNARARDFMLKIRRRKGLRDEPDLGKYVDSRVLKILSMA